MGTVKYTGPVASFHCPTNAEIRSLKVHFSPKQEGSGDPSPENVREIVGWDGVVAGQSGKNCIDESFLSDASNYTVSGSYGYVYTDYLYLAPNTKYRFVWFNTSDITMGSANLFCAGAQEYIVNNGHYRQYPNGFTTDETGKIRFGINKSAAYSTAQEALDAIFNNGKLLLQVGVEDIPYEPYHGVTTDYEFGVLGKNKFDNNTVINNSWIRAGNLSEENPLGSIKENASGYTLSSYISVYSNTTYTIKYNTSSLATAAGMVFFSEQNSNSAISGISLYYQTYINSSTTREYYTFTTPDNCHYLRISTPPNASDVQLELGSTATAYEPYDPNHTVYGGWVDLITGEVNETNIVYTGGWVQYAESNGYKRYELTNILLGDRNNLQNISNITKLFSNISSSTKDNCIQPVSQGSASIRAYLSLDENINVDNIQYGYKLATPNTYHLTPTQLQTFLGQNNVWSNADYVEVEYDLHETQDILARKQFIIANQPHIVKPAAAPLQTFTTDVPAPLKECKVYFSLVQEGEGDPSPENVRTITGWTGVTGYCAKDNLFSTYGIEYGKWTSSTGNVITDASYGCITQKIPVNGGTFSLRALTFPYSMSLIEYGANKEFIERHHRTSSTSASTFTLSANTKYIAVQVASGSTNSSTITETYLNERGILLVQGEATPEVYTTPIVYSIDWTDSAGMVYGGYVDLVKGEVVQEYYKAIFDGAKYFNVDNVGTKTARALISLSSAGLPQAYISGSRGQICMFNYIHGSMNTNDPWNGYISSANNVVLRISSEYSDKELWKNYLISHHLEIVYKLATPITYQIGPAILKTLRGTNNIWANNNGGNIEVSFWRH